MAYQIIAVHAHQSRFALLSVDSDSDDGEEQLQLSQVAVFMLCTCVYVHGSRDLDCVHRSYGSLQEQQ